MVLFSTLNIHGIIENGNVIGSNSWHGKEFRTTGGFQTKFALSAKDPVLAH